MLCVLVFGALAPTVSRALAAQAHVALIEICTAQGMKYMAVIDGELQEQEPFHVGHDAACGYCLMVAQLPVLPTLEADSLPPANATGRIRIGSGATTVFEREAPTAHPPRAPPTRLV